MIQKYIRATSSKHRDYRSRRNMSIRYNSRSEAEDAAAEQSTTDETAVEYTAANETVAQQLAADEMAAVNREESKQRGRSISKILSQGAIEEMEV